MVTSLLLVSVVPSVKWAQQLLVKRSSNERPLVAMGLCYYPHHAPRASSWAQEDV